MLGWKSGRRQTLSTEPVRRFQSALRKRRRSRVECLDSGVPRGGGSEQHSSAVEDSDYPNTREGELFYFRFTVILVCFVILN